MNGDLDVGFADLVIVLAAWGPCPDCSTPCPGDIDDNGDVGFMDLTSVLANWGPCGDPGANGPAPQSVYDCLQKYNDPGDQAACIEAMILAGTP